METVTNLCRLLLCKPKTNRPKPDVDNPLELAPRLESHTPPIDEPERHAAEKNLNDEEYTQQIAKETHVSPDETCAPTTSHHDSSPDPPNIHQRLWDRAYDELIEEEQKAVSSYERILSSKLRNSDNPASVASEDAENEIGPAHNERCEKMRQLIEDGLKRTKKQTDVKGHIDSGLQIINNLKTVIDKSIQAAPSAAVAWVGVSIGLEILANPTKEPTLNRNGITYILSRMEWYWNLADLLLDKNRATQASLALQDSLESHILSLYKKLLLYQMRSVCLYYRGWAKVLLRDFIKLDDWEGVLDDIKEAETLVRGDFELYNTADIKLTLKSIEENTALQLHTILSTLEKQTEYFKDQDINKEDKKCLQDLCLTDPQKDKLRIQKSKGGLLKDSYVWILQHESFKGFIDNPEHRLLWIKGDPGRGKTMLLCGIIDELRPSAKLLSYFFCQATSKNLSSQTAVLRGLIYLLVKQQPSLISSVRDEYDKIGTKMFEEPNASTCLEGILLGILEQLDDAIFIVDALDECTSARDELVELIMRLSRSGRAKWIISSRNWPEIESLLGAARKVTVQLELNKKSISQAVKVYISRRVDELAASKGYDEDLKCEVWEYLVSHASDTFLWVALVCQQLQKCNGGRMMVREELHSLPPGLAPFYKQMMDRISKSNRASHLKQILATVCIAYRPLALIELRAMLEPLSGYDRKDLKNIIELCGSFLTLQENVVYFVHQSAQDFLLNEGQPDILPLGVQRQHAEMFRRSLNLLKSELRRDICNLGSPGCLIDEVKPSQIDSLGLVTYSCIHWANHLFASDYRNSKSKDSEGEILEFFKPKLLQWLEALSLLRSLPGGIANIIELESTLDATDMHEFNSFIRDTRRFVLSHKACIEMAPLQVYASALIFTPTRSPVRAQFHQEEPKWILQKPELQKFWDECIQSLDRPSDSKSCHCIAYSPSGKYFASYRLIGHLEVWDAASGHCVQTLKIPGGEDGFTMSFSTNGTELTFAADSAVTTWDWVAGVVKHSFKIGANLKNPCGSFSLDGKQVVVGDGHTDTLRIWDVRSGQCRDLTGHSGNVRTTALSANGKHLATVSWNGTIRVWDTATGECIQTLEDFLEDSDDPEFVAFSADGKTLAMSIFADFRAEVWNWESGTRLRVLEGHTDSVEAISPFGEGSMFISGSGDHTVKIWDERGACIKTLIGHKHQIRSLCISPNGRFIASGDVRGTLKIWDIARVSLQCPAPGTEPNITCLPIRHDWAPHLDKYAHEIRSLAFSLHGKVLVIDSISPIRAYVWHLDKSSSTAFEEYSTIMTSSQSGQFVVKRPRDGFCIWDLAKNAQIQSIKTAPELFSRVSLSNNGKLVSVFDKPEISIYNTSTGSCVKSVRDYSWTELGLISEDLASAAIYTQYNSGVAIWDLTNETYLMKVRQLARPLALSSNARWIATEADTSTGITVVDLEASSSQIQMDITKMTDHLPSREDVSLSLPYRDGLLDLSTPETRSQGFFVGYGIVPRRDWIFRGKERLLWIPAEYRNLALDVSTSQVAFCTTSGRIMLARLEPDESQ